MSVRMIIRDVNARRGGFYLKEGFDLVIGELVFSDANVYNFIGGL